MSTPLVTPLTLNLTIETREELLALMLRANLDPSNVRTWYHEHRGRTNVNVPDVSLGAIFKALKAHAEEEGFGMTIDNAPSAPVGKSVDISL